MKVSDTVSSTTKGVLDVDFVPSSACASLFQRSLSTEERSDEHLLFSLASLVRDTVSYTTKVARDVDFVPSRACASLFQRSLRSLTSLQLDEAHAAQRN